METGNDILKQRSPAKIYTMAVVTKRTPTFPTYISGGGYTQHHYHHPHHPHHQSPSPSGGLTSDMCFLFCFFLCLLRLGYEKRVEKKRTIIPEWGSVIIATERTIQ